MSIQSPALTVTLRHRARMAIDFQRAEQFEQFTDLLRSVLGVTDAEIPTINYTTRFHRPYAVIDDLLFGMSGNRLKLYSMVNDLDADYNGVYIDSLADLGLVLYGGKE